MITNEVPKCTECKNRAKFEIRDVGGVRAYSCREHKPKRSGGRAPFEIGKPECSATMKDGLGCNKPARFVVQRPFSGIESMCCGTHSPSALQRAHGNMAFHQIGGTGS